MVEVKVKHGTGIGWTHPPGYTGETWNPVVGCTKVSEGCRHCYAKKDHDRRHKGYMNGAKLPEQYAHPFETVQLKPERLDQPLHWKKPRCVFVNSVSDLFHEDVPNRFICEVFETMASWRWPNKAAAQDGDESALEDPGHFYLILTKRPERMLRFFTEDYADVVGGWPGDSPLNVHLEVHGWPLPNVGLGVSVENQATADERIPLLLQTPAAMRFVSYEPALGPVDFKRFLARERFYMMRCEHCGWVGTSELAHLSQNQGDADVVCPACERITLADEVGSLDWGICGFESGKNARPGHPDWARGMRDQFGAAGKAFFFKQWGEWEIASHDNGHFDSDMARNGALWVHSDGLVNGPSWHREDGRTDTNPCAMVRVGKKAAGHLLDGEEHFEWPPQMMTRAEVKA